MDKFIPDSVRIIAHQAFQELSRTNGLSSRQQKSLEILEKIAYLSLGDIPTEPSMQESPKDSMQSKGEVSKETIALEKKAQVFHVEKIVEACEKNKTLKRRVLKIFAK